MIVNDLDLVHCIQKHIIYTKAKGIEVSNPSSVSSINTGIR